jgi:hypothetical protein
VVDRVDATVDGVADQAPEPALPALDPAQQAIDAVVETCGRLPACP